MNFPIDNKFLWKLLSISCDVLVYSHINYNNKLKIGKCYFQLLKDTNLHKDWSHAAERPVDNFAIQNQKFTKIFEQLFLGTNGAF